MSKVTVPAILREKAKGAKLTMLTAYDYSMARIIDEAGVHMILVGDSLGNVVLGYPTTLPVTVDEMIHHTKAVSRGVKNALLIGDMPFLSYHGNIEKALHNAGRFVKEAGAEAVKVEGGANRVEVIRLLVDSEIPVMGHIGLTPQSYNRFGGYRVQGKTAETVKKALLDAEALEMAGVFAMVLEGMPWQLAQKITENVSVPTIGIGAGPHCDGQVLVINDLLGISREVPKFVKKFADLDAVITQAVSQYRTEVEEGRFPTLEQSYELPESIVIPDLGGF